MTTLSDRIKEVSANLPRGWQADLARYCKIKQPSVADWVSGKTKTLEGENLLKAADFFRVTPTWLATGLGTKGSAKESKTSFEQKILDLATRIPEDKKHLATALLSALMDDDSKEI